MAKIKGKTIYDYKKFIEENCSKDQKDLIFDKCCLEETKKLKSTSVISGNWYDVEIYKDLIKAFCEVCPGRLEEVGEFLVNRQIPGIFGVLTRFWSLDRLLDGADRNWKRYYTDSEIVIEKPSENHYDVKIKGIDFSDELLELTMIYMRKMVEKATRKKVFGKTVSKKNDFSEIEFKIVG